MKICNLQSLKQLLNYISLDNFTSLFARIVCVYLKALICAEMARGRQVYNIRFHWPR